MSNGHDVHIIELKPAFKFLNSLRKFSLTRSIDVKSYFVNVAVGLLGNEMVLGTYF